MQGKKLGLSSWTSPGWRGAQGALARGSAYTRPQCRAACSFCGGKNLAVSGIQQHLQGRGPLGLNPSGAGEAYSMGIRNCTVSSGWAVPGRTSWMKKLVRKTRSWGLPSWYRGYLQGGGGCGERSCQTPRTRGSRDAPTGSTGHHAHGAEEPREQSPSGQPFPHPVWGGQSRPQGSVAC